MDLFAADTSHFAPSGASFMINYRVDDLDELLQTLRTKGCSVIDRAEELEFGKFGWVVDSEGNQG